MGTTTKRNQPAAAKRAVADRALENQKRMILDLMMQQGIKIYLTPKGKALLWGKPVPERVDGGGMKITYRNARAAAREVG